MCTRGPQLVLAILTDIVKRCINQRLTQHEVFYPGPGGRMKTKSVGCTNNTFIWGRPALKTLVFLVYCASYLQCPVDADVSFSQNCMANLQQSYISFTRRSKRPMSMGAISAATIR